MVKNITNILYDKKIISDLKFVDKSRDIVCWSKRSKYRIYIPKNVTKQISYLSGVIVGDGNVSITKRKITKYPRTKIRIFNKSEKFLKYVNNEFYNTFKIGGYISKKKDKNCYILTINNKIINLYFIKIIGLQSTKKKNLKIPYILTNSRLFKYFIAGLFDTDGFRTDTYGIMMNGSNYDFLKDIKRLLNKFYGIESRKIYYGYIDTKTGQRERTQFQIKSKSMERFINIVPLKHNRYGPVV